MMIMIIVIMVRLGTVLDKRGRINKTRKKMRPMNKTKWTRRPGLGAVLDKRGRIDKTSSVRQGMPPSCYEELFGERASSADGR